MNDSREIYYIVLRGSRQQPILQNEADRQRFFDSVTEAVSTCPVTVHAFCWMPNEARFAAQIAANDLSRFADRVAQRYSPGMADEISLAGSKLDQTFRGVQIDGLEDLPELVRHIHLAPLRAGLTEHLADYRWSSHLAYMGAVSVPWLETSTTLCHFRRPGQDAGSAYAWFMRQGVERLELQNIGETAGAGTASAARPLQEK